MKRLAASLPLLLAAFAAIAALPTTITIDAHSKLYQGSSTLDNEIVIETDDVTPYGTCLLQSASGDMDVVVSVDGVNFATAPYAMTDLGAETTDPVLVTTDNRTYGIRGVFKKIRVLQNGDDDVTRAEMRCSVM